MVSRILLISHYYSEVLCGGDNVALAREDCGGACRTDYLRGVLCQKAGLVDYANLTSVVIKPYVLKNLLTKIRAVGNRRVELEQEEEGRFGR